MATTFKDEVSRPGTHLNMACAVPRVEARLSARRRSIDDVAILEREWQERFAPLLRFTLQIAIWLSAAFAAIWISDQFRVRWFV